MGATLLVAVSEMVYGNRSQVRGRPVPLARRTNNREQDNNACRPGMAEPPTYTILGVPH